MEERIFLSEIRSATTAVYFTNGFIGVSTIEAPIFKSFVELDSIGRPIRVSNYDGKEIWRRNSENNYEYSQQSSTLITGYSYTNKFNHSLSQGEKNSYTNRFVNRYSNLTQAAINSLSANTDFNNPNQVNYVFFEDTSIDDYYANIYLHRTSQTLDTFNIYNNLLESTPNQQSNYGVLFGKLEAIQVIKDINGNNIRIPLRNVPIGIFNPSDAFPTPTSQDDNGDRIFLNLKESSVPNQYFNIQSYSADNNLYLRSGSAFSGIPAQYKYVTKTNENGEFVIYDAPIGSQTLIFEVDLLKQGLTPEEVALNFFPYPANFDSSVDQIPHFFYRQIPVNVVSAWGDFQTGYTEVNIQANLDLRKWATFFIPPMATQRISDGTDAKTVDDLVGAGTFRFFNVEIRDMSRDDFPTNTISVVEIENMFDRKPEQALEWESEFAQRKDKAVFRTNDYHAFKVPANMYDPNAFKRRGDGTPTNLKGVWLAGYQYKMYFVDNNVFRATGFHRIAPSGPTRNNYDLNKNIQDITRSSNDTRLGGRGLFPYDRKWDHTYPEPYSIPTIPTTLNPNKTYQPQGNPSVGQPIEVTEPKYLDGDLVGSEVDNLAGGYGIMIYQPYGNYIPTRFAQRVTKNLIYKYESGVTLDDKYTNGYIQGTRSIGGSISIVSGGEKWQRVECGHGYFLLPEGWPGVQNNQWGDSIIATESSPSNANIVNFEFKDLALIMDTAAPIKEGYLNIYRVVNPTPQNILDPDAPSIPTFTRFIIERVYRLQDRSISSNMHTGYNNSAASRRTNDNRLLIYGTSNNNGNKAFFGFKIRITNLGLKSVRNPVNQSQEFGIGDTIEIDSNQILDPIFDIENNQPSRTYNSNPNSAFSFTLEGNSGFDRILGKYTKSQYRFEILYDPISIPQNRNQNAMDTSPFIFGSSNADASESTINVFLKTSYTRVVANARSTSNPQQSTSNPFVFAQDNRYLSFPFANLFIRGLILGVDNNSQSRFSSYSWVASQNQTSPINQVIQDQNTPPPRPQNSGQLDEYIGTGPNSSNEFSTGWQI